MQASAADLPAACVERQLTVEGYALAGLDEPTCLAHITETESFKPGERKEGKAIVELTRVDVFRLVVSLLPQLGSCRIGGDPVRLIPAMPLHATGLSSDPYWFAFHLL